MRTGRVAFPGARGTFRGGPRHSSLLLLLRFTSTLVRMELVRETGTGPFRCPRSGCKCMCRPSGEASTHPVLLGALITDQCVLDRNPGVRASSPKGSSSFSRRPDLFGLRVKVFLAIWMSCFYDTLHCHRFFSNNDLDRVSKLQAKPGQLPAFTNKVLLAHSHMHSFTYCL